MATIQNVYLDTFDPELYTAKLDYWLHQPHVTQWWGNPERVWKKILQHPPENTAVIVADDIPVGYLCWQKPTPEELKAAGLEDLPNDLVDIDIMIGDPDFIGYGIGPRALTCLLIRLQRDSSISSAGLATSISNTRAIRAYEKAGFRLFRVFQDPEEGLCQYMIFRFSYAV